jgi:catechol 2,3-dioxygenase-like lactoylglutathione lyase family enzyme
MEKIDHIAFQVGGLDESIQFYVDTLGFRLLSRSRDNDSNRENAFLALEDMILELVQDYVDREHDRPEIQRPFCPHLAIEVEDIGKSALNLRKLGVNILCGPLAIPGEEAWLYFTDPDNNVLEYIQWLRNES